MATWDQTARTAALDQFRKGVVSLLVASDVAARGLDIPVPGLTTKRARMCAIPRRTVKRPIMASAPMISAQRDCQLVSCLLAASQLQDQATAICLRLDRGPARRPMRRSASLALQKTTRSTNHVRGRRISIRAQLEQHVGQEFSVSDARSFGSK